MTTTSQLQVAFATTDGITVDGHFGSCEQFYIFTIDSEQYQQIDVRKTQPGRGIGKNIIRADLINDCQLLFCASIGGPAAARVIRNDIHPMKCKPIGDKFPAMIDQLEQLKQRMKNQLLPPWLAKLTAQPNQLKARFDTL